MEESIIDFVLPKCYDRPTGLSRSQSQGVTLSDQNVTTGQPLSLKTPTDHFHTKEQAVNRVDWRTILLDQSKFPKGEIWTRMKTDKNRWENRRKTQMHPQKPNCSFANILSNSININQYTSMYLYQSPGIHPHLLWNAKQNNSAFERCMTHIIVYAYVRPPVGPQPRVRQQRPHAHLVSRPRRREGTER
jgi:hypothetical protein